MSAKKGKNKEKRPRPSSSTGDELEQDGRHYEELLALYKALEQKDAEKSVEIASLKALLQEARDNLKSLNDKVAALEASIQFTQNEQDEVKDRLATCEKDQIIQENELTRQSIYSRRWNLLFFKINENQDENCHQLVKEVLINSLKFEEEYVNNIPLCGVHRLGKKRPNANQPRPIIVRFTCRANQRSSLAPAPSPGRIQRQNSGRPSPPRPRNSKEFSSSSIEESQSGPRCQSIHCW